MSSRKILDIRKKAAPSRAHARVQMTSLFSQKPLRLKTRRRRQRILTFCVCIVCAAGSIGGLGFATHAPQFAIKDISVTGTHMLSPQALSASVATGLHGNWLKIFSYKNMFLYPQAAIEETLSAEFPRIKTVSVARPSLLATALVVTVQEREPYATWCDVSEKCYFLDAQGYVFAESDAVTPKTAYVFHGGLANDHPAIGQTFLQGRFTDMVALLQGLAKAGYIPEGITIESEKDFSIPLQGGPRLLVAFDMDAATLLKNLQATVTADALKGKFATLQYIDLRFGNRVYYQ